MFSSRLYSILNHLFRLGIVIRSNAQKFDNILKLLTHVPSLQSQVSINFLVFTIFIALRILIIIQLRNNGNNNMYHISVAFLAATLMVTIVYGIPLFYTKDSNLIMNAVTIFFRRLNRTLNKM